MFDQSIPVYAGILEDPVATLLPTAVFALNLLAFVFIFSLLVFCMVDGRDEA